MIDLKYVQVEFDNCYFCHKPSAVVLIGEDIDYESSASRVCSECLEELISILPRYK